MSSSGFSSSGSFASLNLAADKRRDQEQASLVTPLKMEKPNPKSLLSPRVQCAPESDDPYSAFHATQWNPTKYSNSDSSVSGPPISMPEELKRHGTTVMGYVLPNIPSLVVQADGLSDLDQDFKLVEDGDYVFGAAGDGNICADII
ncbi:hypothetical protein C5167_010251 [Papaver somniferum]|uniref:Uncharacterized protein n=1 Tax=Papaver somniferum TaxID=3469 RepID=A0A4Y7K3P4_PAPSO|nr:hypothetical protein C5167_010251 [Papaver somniferum]